MGELFWPGIHPACSLRRWPSRPQPARLVLANLAVYGNDPAPVHRGERFQANPSKSSNARPFVFCSFFPKRYIAKAHFQDAIWRGAERYYRALAYNSAFLNRKEGLAHACLSTITADGNGAYCAKCGEVLE